MATYDRFASYFDVLMWPLERLLLARLRRELINRLPGNGQLLEVGAGSGLNFSFYATNAKGVATEPSSEMLRQATKKQRPNGIALVQSFAEQLPFADGSFDAAFASLVFCSVHFPDIAFSEMKRVVRKGGTVVLLEHVRPNGLLGPVFDLINAVTVPLFDDHFNRRTADVAQAAGFAQVTVTSRAYGMINLIDCRV